jgi:iron(III) transport system ATP-binding protein
MFLHIEGLSFRYAGRQETRILDRFSLSLRAGEIFGIAGPSGQGKSTLLRLIAGLERPDEGSIRIDGLCVAGPGLFLPPEERGVGMLFQDYGLFPHMTVERNVAYGLHRLPRAQRGQRTRAMLQLVDMEGLARRYPYELSGGQQQRVALARALAPEPKLLLLDEPFSNLDAALKESIRAEIFDVLSRLRMTCLLVSHDMADLEAVCSRIRVLGQEG